MDMHHNKNKSLIFSEFQKSLDEEQLLREVIRNICKEIDSVSREITTVLQVIHYDEARISPACLQVRELLTKANAGYLKLQTAVPSTDYYKQNSNACTCMCSGLKWAIAGEITEVMGLNILPLSCRHNVIVCTTLRIAILLWISRPLEAYNTTLLLPHFPYNLAGERNNGISRDCSGNSWYAVEEKTGFHLDIEDYLIGLLNLCSELSRLAVNSVTREDYNRPLQISKFVMEINAGFRLLNLKNDHLRKRFDALKYDVKKIEEVVYDLSIRGLLPKQSKDAVMESAN